MSQQEFEKSDQEVMDLVNSAASPQSKRTADAIERELTQPAVRCEETAASSRRDKAIGHAVYAAAGVAAAVAMVVALKKPECMVYIANAFCLIGGVSAALHIEKLVKLLRK